MECNDGEMIPAGEFLPIAEKLGLCRLIDYRTLELAIDLLKEDEALHLALNVSSLTTNDPNWLIVMRAKAGRDRSVIERLMVEITETVSIKDLEETASFVASLRDLGCSVAIDDFGAGYSSYKNLRVLDVDVVKIDGDFIKDILQCKEDQIFVGSLIALAKSFDMKTVAEWVDNEETACFLRDMGIDYLQGFAMGRPKVVQLKPEKPDASSDATEKPVAQAQ
jgi:EAL domain-containing protein (putative c-di-GMP-specific phosphodiesterase class I)